LFLINKVKLKIKNVNEFEPKFVEPLKPISLIKNENPNDFFVSNKMFTFKVEENKDFELQVKAEDLDDGVDGQLVYNIETINQDDEFLVEAAFNNASGKFEVKIAGMYLDAGVKTPIQFIVAVHDNGSPRFGNEIIVNLLPVESYFRPAYFELQKYEFELIEKQQVFHN
jgi:hypothetical protein